jgi:RHS repeat-associated protein
MIPAADGGVVQLQVAATVGSNGGVLVLNPANYKAPKNGYVYIYLSNQSNDYVYWDNFQAGITQGNIAEENHYYAYGLKIATLSSKKLGDVYEGQLKNNYLYQGGYSELDEDIGWNDFMLRNYDAQIGRWVQQDPFQQFASPYVGMGNDPINNTDPSGGVVIDPIKTLETVVVTATRARHVTQAASVINTLSNVTKVAGWAAKVSSIINTSIATKQAGDPRALIFARGSADAILNANTFGITDLWGSTSNLDDYEDDLYDQQAYLQGRLAGDAFAVAQSATEIKGGISGGLSSGAGTAGAGLVAGGLVVGHGAAVGSTATYDAGWATKKLFLVNKAIQASTTVYSSSGDVTPSSSGETSSSGGGMYRSKSRSWGTKADYNVARKAALEWLIAKGFKAEKAILGKFGTSKGKPIGMSSLDGKIGFRVEFDARNGAHINVWSGKEKGPHFKFNASEKTINQIIKRFLK